MGTINYRVVNANHVYAIENESASSDWEYEDFISDRLSELLPNGWTIDVDVDSQVIDCEKWSNIAEDVLAAIQIPDEVAHLFLSHNLECFTGLILCPGYYSYANLDYEIMVRFFDPCYGYLYSWRLSDFDGNVKDMVNDIVAYFNDNISDNGLPQENIPQSDAQRLLHELSLIRNQCEEAARAVATDTFDQPGWAMKKIG